MSAVCSSARAANHLAYHGRQDGGGMLPAGQVKALNPKSVNSTIMVSACPVPSLHQLFIRP